MQAFHNDPVVKQFYVDRMTEHHRLDQIIQGKGWDGSNGCNVGCILHRYEHSAYITELGLPEWYAHLCDKIFEGLPKDKAPSFALATLTAIKTGVDIRNVKWQLAIARHQRNLIALEGNKELYAEECRNALKGVIAYCRQQIVGFENESAATAAWSAAWSAAESAARATAWSAARAAAAAADSAAWSAARAAAESAAAESAARAADSAAWSAWSARAESMAARADHYVWEAETLIALLLEVK